MTPDTLTRISDYVETNDPGILLPVLEDVIELMLNDLSTVSNAHLTLEEIREYYIEAALEDGKP